MLKPLIRDPLLHFLVFGFLLYFVSQQLQWSDTDFNAGSDITVTQDKQKQLVALFESSWQRKPTESEITGLINNFVLEEIYYREALMLGLDKNDTVIRQRLKQKLEFLQEDMSNFGEPDGEQLNNWYLNNQEQFLAPARYSFDQVLLKSQDAGRLEFLLSSLNDGTISPNELSASGLLELKSTGLTEQAVVNRFGNGFLGQLSKLPQSDKWQGPLESVFGTHLVLINQILEARRLEFDDIKDRVLIEYQSDRRQESKTLIEKRLKDSYRINVE